MGIINIMTRTIELTGTSSAIGRQMTENCGEQIISVMRNGEELCKTDMHEITGLLNQWCPGLNDELQGFADASGIPVAQVAYYAGTYLRPSCSQIAISAQKSASGHPILARSYEYHHDLEEFTLARTSVKGKNAHIGTCVMMFGREEGINDKGLAVAMSMNTTREIKTRGMMFWAALRSVLENCATVEEAVNFLKGMPVAYNMNMLLMDSLGKMALYETMDGQNAYRYAAPEESFLAATNHPLLDSITAIHPYAAVHSLQRYHCIHAFLTDHTTVNITDIKGLLLTPYPMGLSCSFFEDYLGTTKSVVMDIEDKTLEICWGGREENGWEHYSAAQPLTARRKEIWLTMNRGEPELFKQQPL
ncbi:acyl-CoA--6-aminopenicillanic acid acyl-transferase [Lachnospiraceae bacterium]|nr:acyl-CoA--6-aminopenicillanic acid acyl-transferase [Lachnospiraceae bacterium]GKH41949.1 acyl-CoA--6-aminopenicillanic acid acyl-transferase [Lachnospiraceae bacterium]